MTIKINCPVCDRPGVGEDLCPNCETDLTLIRGLTDLPTMSVAPSPMIEQKSTIPAWLLLAAIAFLALGIVLGGVGVYWPTQNKISQLDKEINQLQVDNAQLQTKNDQLQTKIASTETHCTRGFDYVVKRGDSLSLLALRFYGDAEQQNLIVQKNPSLQGKEDFLEIGDELLIPNLNGDCL